MLRARRIQLVLTCILCVSILGGGCNYPRTINTVLPPVVQGNLTPTTVSIAPPPPTETSSPAPTIPLPAASPDPTNTQPPLPTSTPTPIPPPASPPNVILIIVDSLRADHVSSNGYARPTTPNLDQLVVMNGAHFRMAISSASWTCPSNASMHTGLDPVQLGASWFDLEQTVPKSATTLAEYLSQAGYYTAAFINNSCVGHDRGFDQGFHYFDDSVLSRPNIHNSDKVRGGEVNNRMISWLQANQQDFQEKPLFLLAYYMEPHPWYNPPAPYDTLYDPDYNGSLTPETFGVGKDAMSGALVLSERDIQHLIALYDGEISEWDANFGQLMTELNQMNLLENTLLIVTADHGESFGEHSKWVHGTSLYQEQIQVPLVMSYTGQIPPNTVIDAPVQNMDLMPTILDWAGIILPEGLDAVSLRPVLQGAPADTARPVFSQLDAVKDPSHWAYWQAPRLDERLPCCSKVGS